MRKTFSGIEQGGLVKAVYVDCKPSIVSYVLGHNGTYEDAKDVLSNVYLYLVQNVRRSFNAEVEHSRSYIFASARNIWIKELKYRKRLLHLSDLPSVFDQIIYSEEPPEIKQLKYSLFIKYYSKIDLEGRMILKYSIKGLSSRQGAYLLGISEDAYKKRKSRYIQHLKRIVREDTLYLSNLIH